MYVITAQLFRKCMANPQQSLPILVSLLWALEPWLKVAFKGRPNIIWLLALFITYETYNITFTSKLDHLLPYILLVKAKVQALHNLILIEGAIFFKIGHFSHQIIALEKLWKMFFISSENLFSFLRYSNFCISKFPSFSPCHPLL